jgi:ATP-dependent RNA helicase DDX55/SPB4
MVCTDILARGVDIEDVDWVIQFDPPRAANSFVHRCGRTARSGREGNALIYILPNEECYVNFLNINQKVPLNKFDESDFPNVKNEEVIKKIQTLASTDRYLNNS